MIDKRYYRYYIKKLLPMGGIVLGIFLLMSLLNGMISSVYKGTYLYYNESAQAFNGYTISYPSSGLEAVLFPAAIFSFVLPFILFSYRYRRENADLYRQFPLKKNELASTRIFAGLTIWAVILTAGFLLVMSIILLKSVFLTSYDVFFQDACVDAVLCDHAHYEVNVYHGWYYLLALPCFLLVNLSIFGFSSFVCQKANSLRDAIFGALALGAAMAIAFIVLFAYLAIFGHEYGSDAISFFWSGNLVYGPIGSGLSYYLLFSQLIVNGSVGDVAGWDAFGYALAAINVLLGLDGLVLSLLAKEPSGDCYGGKGYRGVAMNAIFIGGIAILMLLASLAMAYTSLFYVIGGAIIYIHAAALCFFFFVMLNRGLRLGKRNFLIYGLVVGVPLVLAIIATMVGSY